MTKQAYQVLIIDDCPEDRATFQRFLSEKCRGNYVVADTERWQEGLALADGADRVLLD